jgi:hypothetical protein
MVSLPLPVATCVAALVSAIAATLGGVAARGSTAVPAAAWATAACLAFALESAARAAGALADPATAASARLGVSALAMAPAMSLLGAKRPQHGVWQLIVASLAVVLVMPAASALLVRPGSLPDIHLLERGFLLVLALVGWMNFVGTRRWAAATLVAAGQLAIIRPFLPLVATADALPQQLVDCVGGWLVAAGAALAAVQAFRPKPAAPPGPAALVTPPFLALRETLDRRTVRHRGRVPWLALPAAVRRPRRGGRSGRRLVAPRRPPRLRGPHAPLRHRRLARPSRASRPIRSLT